MRTLLIFTDTTSSQVNGVTRCIGELRERLPDNIELELISADDFVSIPFIGYKEIRLSLAFPRKIYKKIRELQPDYIHIETEWPVGLMAAAICRYYKIPYTTTFHTKFPEYLNMRNRLVKEDYVHKYLHFIHDRAERIFISNPGMITYLEENNYGKYSIVPLGIDHSLFFPWGKQYFQENKKPKLLYVGRIALEKNIEDFLEISDQYEKIVVGDGPQREELEERYPDAKFLGIKKWQELADIYRSVDVFVFPSKTDTLGLVNLEAMACGKPVVAYDIDNMRGIITHGKNGILVAEWSLLENGIIEALRLNPQYAIDTAQWYCWTNYVQEFLAHQSPIPKTLWT